MRVRPRSHCFTRRVLPKVSQTDHLCLLSDELAVSGLETKNFFTSSSVAALKLHILHFYVAI